MERETEIEEYKPRDRGLKARLPASITCWVPRVILSIPGVEMICT